MDSRLNLIEYKFTGLQQYLKIIITPEMTDFTGLIAMNSAYRIVLVFFVTVFLTTVAIGEEVYQYTNAAGRTVYSKAPPDGVGAVKKKQAGSREYRNTSDDDHGIYNDCNEKWGLNFEMKENCIRSQKDARRNIQKYDHKIVSFCRDRWKDNYEMIEYCAKKQSSARRRLGE